MNGTWPRVKFREFLRPNSRPYLLGPEEDANLVGMRLYGAGPFHRELKPAMQIAKKSHFVIKAGDVIYNKLFAWKGTFGIVPPKLDCMFVSDKFPTYELDREKVDERFLGWYFRCPPLWDEAKGMSTGSAALSKLTLNPPKFLFLTMPLPPLAEQRRIVARIEELVAQIHEARSLRQQAAEEADKIQASFLMHLFDGAQTEQRFQVPLGKVCSFQGGSQPPKLQFAYEPREGHVRLIQIRDYKSDNYPTYVARDSVRKFCTKDDVMIGRYGPPIFQILRGIEGAYNVALMKATPDESQLSKDFLFHLLQEPRFFQKVEEDSQRSSGQTGIRRELLEEHMTFIPPLHEQRRIVSELDGLQTQVDALKRLQAETAAELDALLPSILDRAFKGEL